MFFLPKTPLTVFSLHQFLSNNFTAEPSTADLPLLPKGFLSASPEYFALHCMGLEPAKKLQLSQITTLWLYWLECPLGRRQTTEEEKDVRGHYSQFNKSNKPVWLLPTNTQLQNHTCSVLQAELVCSPITIHTSLPLPASPTAALLSQHRSLEWWHTRKAVMDLPVCSTLPQQDLSHCAMQIISWRHANNYYCTYYYR